MSAIRDPLDGVTFATIEEAKAHCEKYGFDVVLQLEGPAYADKPFVCVKYVLPGEGIPGGAIVGEVGDDEGN